MSLEVFRRHQKKLLAVFAILAMFGFVLSDSLPKLLSSSNAGRDRPVVTLKWKTIYQSDLDAMAMQRSNANQFFSQLIPYRGATPFGTLKTRDLVDAVILEHEADRLGIPTGPAMGRDWLKQVTQGQMTRELFEELLTRFNSRVSGEQILSDLANQVRLANVRMLLGAPMVTPFDVFRAYRDQNERVSAKLVEVPVEKFLAQVPEPTPQDIQAYYDQYKDVLPAPDRATPGFKIPHQIQVEILSVDGNALARSIKDKLSEQELRAAYENRKQEFEVRSNPDRGDLPTDLFAGQPELTPPTIRPFAEVRSTLASSLAEEKAQNAIIEMFGRIKDDVLIPFADQYQTALIEIEEATKQGSKPKTTLPVPSDLKEVAKRERLHYDLTPMLSREEAERYGQISGAEVGLARLSGGRKFADEFFDPKTSLYEPEELTDLLGTRYLARKIKDVPPRVPSLDEVRSQVSLAWKMNKARPLARKAADLLAEQIKKKGASIKETTVEGNRVLTIPPIPRRQGSMLPGRFDMEQLDDTPIPEVDQAGTAFREAYFSLQPGSVAVAPNQPETAFYVMALDKRDPATFATLYYTPNSEEFRYKMVARQQAERDLVDHWMGWLRQEAGLKADWVPADEAKSESAKKAG
jgi:hypothetical protein